MIRITNEDFHKLVKLLTKDGMQGAFLSFRMDGVKLQVTTLDKTNKEMMIEISDVSYPFVTRVTKTETF